MSTRNHWTVKDIPDQSGSIVIITGANSGIGYETARVLAQKGMTVVMACRNLEKAQQAASQIRAENPKGAVEVALLDLSDLDSVKTFADNFRRRHEQLAQLINNAGIMHPPYGQTKQGFETAVRRQPPGSFRPDRASARYSYAYPSLAHRHGEQLIPHVWTNQLR